MSHNPIGQNVAIASSRIWGCFSDVLGDVTAICFGVFGSQNTQIPAKGRLEVLKTSRKIVSKLWP